MAPGSDPEHRQAARLALGSAAWFAEISTALLGLVDAFRDEFRGRTFSFQEVFTGVPEAVSGTGSTTAWHVRILDGRVVALGFGPEPVECELTVHVDWAAAGPVARAVSATPGYDEMRMAMVTAGHARVEGDPTPKAAVQRVFDMLHDHMAPLTA